MTKPTKAADIFLWWPNIIGIVVHCIMQIFLMLIINLLEGYARVVLALISFLVYESPIIFFWLYLTSFLLDALDGHVARLTNQCTFSAIFKQRFYC